MTGNPRLFGRQVPEWLYTAFWLVVAVGVAIGIRWALLNAPPLWRWALVAGLMLLVLLAAGKWGTTWGWLGALVDPQRGKYSLGQLQLVLWTLVIISAWCAIVVTRILLRVPDGSVVDQLVTEISESYQQAEDALIEDTARANLEMLVSLKSGLVESEEKEADLRKIRRLEVALGDLLEGENEGLLERIAAKERQLHTLLQADVSYADALNVEIPVEVLILLGISGASLVGGVVIKNDKGAGAAGRKPPTLDTANAQWHAAMLAAPASGAPASGAPASGAAADKRLSFLDIFKGDQEGDKSYIDIGKFQMFWFTAAALLAYGMQIASLMDTATSSEVLQAAGLTGHQISRLGFALVTSLPAVSTSLAGVLAISHGTYLANKVPNRPAAEGLESIKIVSLEVGTVGSAGNFQPASASIPTGKVAVQVQPQSSASNAALISATVLVELRSSAAAVPVLINMGGKTTAHAVSSADLAPGDWQAVVVQAWAGGYGELDTTGGFVVKDFKVV